MTKEKSSILIRVYQERPGRYVARRVGRPRDLPLGTGATVTHALGGARRQAPHIASSEHVSVRIEVEQPDGYFRNEGVFVPLPAH